MPKFGWCIEIYVYLLMDKLYNIFYLLAWFCHIFRKNIVRFCRLQPIGNEWCEWGKTGNPQRMIKINVIRWIHNFCDFYSAKTSFFPLIPYTVFSRTKWFIFDQTWLNKIFTCILNINRSQSICVKRDRKSHMYTKLFRVSYGNFRQIHQAMYSFSRTLEIQTAGKHCKDIWYSNAISVKQ